jgi:hypothetical protein
MEGLDEFCLLAKMTILVSGFILVMNSIEGRGNSVPIASKAACREPEGNSMSGGAGKCVFAL